MRVSSPLGCTDDFYLALSDCNASKHHHSPKKTRIVFQFLTKLEDCCYRMDNLGQCFSQGMGSEEVYWS